MVSALTLLAVAVVTVATVQVTRDDGYGASPGAANRPRPDPAAATRALRALEEAVVDGDAEAAAALAGSSEQTADLLRAVVANAAALEVVDFALRYIDETSRTSSEGQWSAAVDITWRFSGFDRDPVREEVLVGFDATGAGATVTGIGGGDRRTPLWLSAALEVRRDADTLVLVVGSAEEADAFSHRARAAVPAVRAVLPAWPGGLVVEVPAASADLDAMLAAAPGTYADIAAVSTSVDGTVSPSSPTHVFVNPELYGDLGPVGKQVVMTHEATHIATAAPLTSEMPLWLLEGFADYVALRGTDLPMAETAGQVVEQVRSDGVPATLPGSVEFGARATHLGAAYEAAWVACLVVVDVADEAALVRLYDDVRRGTGIDDALRSDVGINEEQLTRAWQDRLETLVSTTEVPA